MENRPIPRDRDSGQLPDGWGSHSVYPDRWQQGGVLPAEWGSSAPENRKWNPDLTVSQHRTQAFELPDGWGNLTEPVRTQAAAAFPSGVTHQKGSVYSSASAISNGRSTGKRQDPVPAVFPEPESSFPDDTHHRSAGKNALAVALIATASVSLIAIGVLFGLNFGKTKSEQSSEFVLSADHANADDSQLIEASQSVSPESQTNSPAPASSESEPAYTTVFRSDASVSEARIVGEYNDFGAGYMFRLDLKGNFSYWVAEVREVQADGETYYSMVCSYDLTDEYPYILGGSLTQELSAEITPFDEHDVPGTAFSVKWNGEEELTISPDYNPFLFTGYVATNKSELNLRSYPFTDADILAKIPKDTKLDLYQSVCDGWYITCYRDKWGFVSSEYISETQGGVPSGSQTAEPWKEAYIEWLQYRAYSEDRTHYALIDFDQNGIPELVTANKSPDVYVYDCPVVYTYANGKMTEVYQDSENGDFGEYQGWWGIYSSSLYANTKSGYCFSDYEGQHIFFRYQNHKLVLEAVFNKWETDYDYMYIYNGYEVSQSEYNERYQKYQNVIATGFKVNYAYDVSDVNPILQYH